MGASIAFQSTATEAGGATSRTLTFTAASAVGQERLVALLAICSGNPASVSFSSVVVGGQSATQIGSYIQVQESSGNGPLVSFWRAGGTSGTSINVTFNIAAGTVFDVRGSLWNLSDAGTLLDTGSEAFASGSANLGNVNLDLDTVTDGAAAAIVLAYNSPTHTATWGGLTERFDGGTLYTQDWFTAADLNVTSGSTPLAVTTFLPSDFTTGSGFVGLAVSFNPAEADTDTDGGTDGEGQQIINIGSAINDGTGDPARVAFDKCNDNFTELYTADTTFAPLASPVFTGDPTAPTQAVTDNDTSIATTEFVKAAIAYTANQTYYFDPTDAADVGGYKRLVLTPSPAAQSTVQVSCSGTSDVLVGIFITDLGVPGALEYPAGSAYRRLYGSVSSGASAKFHLQIYKRTEGGVETLARDEYSQTFSNTTPALIEWLSTPSGASLSVTDRIVIKLYAQRVTGGGGTITVTFYAEGSVNASQIQTTIPMGSAAPFSATSPLSLSAGNLSIDLSAYAALASPTFTGDPKAPTPTAGDNDTSIATTAFVTAAVAAAAPGLPQGRLTLQTATPVMTTTQSAKTTTFYTPYCGNQCPIYNGSSFTMTPFAELSNVTTATSTGSAGPAAVAANSNYDLFVWSNSGTMTLTRGPVWTSDTVRSAGTALVRTGGIWLNNAAITNGPAAFRGTYVGTVRSNGSSQIDYQFGSRAASGGAGIIGVWNCYNRVDVCMRVQSTTATWTYNSTTLRNSNASATWRVSFVSGLEEDSWHAQHTGVITNPAANFGFYYVGLDGTGSTAFPQYSGQAGYFSTNDISTGSLIGTSLGFHYVQAVEACNSTGGNVTFSGNELKHLTFEWRG